jgi:hypothetical protein
VQKVSSLLLHINTRTQSSSPVQHHRWKNIATFSNMPEISYVCPTLLTSQLFPHLSTLLRIHRWWRLLLYRHTGTWGNPRLLIPVHDPCQPALSQVRQVVKQSMVTERIGTKLVSVFQAVFIPSLTPLQAVHSNLALPAATSSA